MQSKKDINWNFDCFNMNLTDNWQNRHYNYGLWNWYSVNHQSIKPKPYPWYVACISAVQPLMVSCLSISQPLSTSIWAMSSCPFMAANIRGVAPSSGEQASLWVRSWSRMARIRFMSPNMRWYVLYCLARNNTHYHNYVTLKEMICIIMIMSPWKRWYALSWLCRIERDDMHYHDYVALKEMICIIMIMSHWKRWYALSWLCHLERDDMHYHDYVALKEMICIIMIMSHWKRWYALSFNFIM